MSTDQTGVNDLTRDDSAEGSQGRAPRSSRRAIRQAERAAEREAILTGQQPLLTRREMRRLREEAAALKAAVEAGEITPEQARALQDPTADQPEVATAGARDAGHEGQPAPGPSAQSPQAAAPWGGDRGAHPAPQGGTPAGAASGAAAPAAAPGAGTAPPAAGPALGEDTVQAPAVAQEPLPEPEPADQPGPSWRSLTADEAVAISELPTGLMDAVDLPIISAEVERAAAEQVTGEPAPVPTRSSLRERLETGQVPSIAGPGSETDSALGAGEPAEGPSAPYATGGGQQAQPVPAWSVEHRPDEAAVLAADAVPVQDARAGGAPGTPDGVVPGAPGAAATPGAPAAPGGPVAPAAGVQGPRAGGQEAPAAASPSSVRRPIVKIPAAAQGVRTVNVSTGELSAVQPVSPAEDGAADEAGRLARPAAQDAAGQVVQDAQETTVQEALPVEGGPEFDAAGVPQWKSLRERMTSESSLVGGRQPVSPYSTAAAAGVEETTSVEYAPVADAGFPAAAGPGAPGGPDAVGAAWGQAPSAVPVAPAAPGVAEVGLSQDEEPQGSSSMGKVLLILLAVLVVVLVVLAIAWYLMSRGSSSSAAALQAAEPWIRQLI